MNGITRRELVYGVASAAAISVLDRPARALGMGGGGMGGGMGGSGSSVIDPPIGGVFANPPLLPNLSSDAAVVEVALAAMSSPVKVNGTSAQLLTYNGLHPGGTIRARRDQLLRVKMTNALPANGATNILGHPMYTTNLHTHGLHVTPGDNMNGTHGDNMMVMLEPGDEAIYEYNLSKQPGGTLNFYHPHIHGCVADQMWGGMAGALVVEDETPVLSAFPEKIMVLKDLTLVGNVPAPHDSMMDYMRGLEGDTVMINGTVNPQIDIVPGSIQRWRLVNACTARFFRLSLTNHTLYVIGTEGGLLDRPYPVSEILLSPGERVDVLIKADRSVASYKFVSLPYSRMGNMGGQTVTLATLTYRGRKATQSLPSTIDPTASRVAMDTSMLKHVQIDLSMGQGRGYINGISFEGHDHSYMTHSMLNTWEVWEITNSSGMDHPFHHHTNSAQVLSITGGDAKYVNLWTTAPAWKDVTIVPKWGSVRLLMPVMDYEGMAMLHCHIIEHEDIGMMGIWHIGNGMGGM